MAGSFHPFGAEGRRSGEEEAAGDSVEIAAAHFARPRTTPKKAAKGLTLVDAWLTDRT